MPVLKSPPSGLVDKLTGIAGGIKDVLEADTDNMYGVRELAKTEAVSGGKFVDGYLVALAIGILWSAGEATIEYRAGKLLVGSK